MTKVSRTRLSFLVMAVAAMLVSVAGRLEAADLRINIDADPATVNPITNSELFAQYVINNLYEGLTALDKDGHVIPALAEKWEAHADNLGFRFWLRKGVKFHSGRELTSKDVEWTFLQTLVPGGKGGLMEDYTSEIVGAQDVIDGKSKELAGFKIIDDYSFDVTFAKPDVIFPIYPLLIVDSHVVEENGPDWFLKVSAGTGPFKFVEWKRGVDVKLEANKDYWRGAPKIDGIDFLIVPNFDTALSMFETNALDLVYVQQEYARQVLKDPQFADQTLSAPAAQINYLGMNQSLYAPFKDERVREAVNLAIDREGLIKGLFSGAAYPLYGLITPGFPGYDPNIPAITYDPERAKKLLAEAGYPDGKGLPPIDIQSTEPNKTSLAYFADQFHKVLGWDVNVKVVERGTFIKAMNAGQVAFFPWGWTADFVDPATFLQAVFYSKSKFNRSRYSDPAFDALIEKALQTPDATARYKYYNQADRVLVDGVGTIPLYVRKQLALKSPKLDGVYLTPEWFLPFYDASIK